MQLVDDKAIARGMIRVSPGEDLVESLGAVAEAAGWQEAFVTGAGTLELCELERGERTVTLENAEVISLSGRVTRGAEGVTVVLQAVLGVGGDLTTGRIAAAMTGGLVMVVDAILAPAGTALASARPETVERPVERQSASALKPPSQGFSSRPIARPISAPDTADAEDEENPMVDVGDVLQHPQLGRCEVVGHDASGGTQVRLSSGKVRVLRLDALRVLPGKEAEEGAMLFEIAGPRRRRSRF